MAIPKKGTRKITVDKETYRWLIRKRPTYGQALAETGMILAIERAEDPGAVLIVKLKRPHPSNWLEKKSVSVLPADVEKYIRMALEEGWAPAKPGKSFELTPEG